MDYLVVELLSQPNTSYPPYLAIPKSWLSNDLTPSRSDEVAVALPTNKFSVTMTYIKEGGLPCEGWGCFLGKSIMNARDLETATYAAETLNKSLGSGRKNTKGRKRDGNETASNFFVKHVNGTWTAHSREQFKKFRKDNKRATKKQKRTTKDDQAPKPNHKYKIPTYSPMTRNRREKTFGKKMTDILARLMDKYGKLRDILASIPPVLQDVQETLGDGFTLMSERESDEVGEHDQPNTDYNYPDNTDKSRKHTLRYSDMKIKTTEGLAELLPESQVYVKANKVNTLIQKFESPSELSHGLILEVFSDKALKQCAGRNIEEILDIYSLKVIQIYVNEFCKINDINIEENQTEEQ